MSLCYLCSNWKGRTTFQTYSLPIISHHQLLYRKGVLTSKIEEFWKLHQILKGVVLLNAKSCVSDISKLFRENNCLKTCASSQYFNNKALHLVTWSKENMSIFIYFLPPIKCLINVNLDINFLTSGMLACSLRRFKMSRACWKNLFLMWNFWKLLSMSVHLY